MKKRIISLCLILVMLVSGASILVSASTEYDPLITLSYLTETFLPRAKQALKNISDRKVQAFQPTESESAPTLKVASVPANETLTLTAGQEITILSGYGRITELSGSIINVTVGWPAGQGRANNCHRYILDADSSATITFTQDSVVSVSAGVETKFVVSPFSDVKKGAWYFNSVVGAYEKGLISGMTLTTYEPAGTLTVAQTIRLAAAMYQLYHDGEVTLKKSEQGQWYESFVAFAYDKGIIDRSYTLLTHEQYNAPITRAEFVHIFYNALPVETYTEINNIPDDTIPDVRMNDRYSYKIYTFYRAGIVSGYTQTPPYPERAFGSDSTITRAEVASILIRMFEPERRTSFTIE